MYKLNKEVTEEDKSEFSRFNFVGYDSSGTTRDPKGVLRLQKERETSKIEKITYREDEPETLEVERTEFECEIRELENEIDRIKANLNLIGLTGSHDIELKQYEAKFQDMQRIKKQVEESLENPRVYRETIGKLVNPPVVNGVRYDVNLSRTQEQISEDKYPYYLKGDELVVSDGKTQVLAHRYFRDPRVVVDGTFEGDVRKPEKFSLNIDEQTQKNLSKLFKQLYPEIQEVAFLKGKKIKTD